MRLEVVAENVANSEDLKVFLDGSTRSETRLHSAIIGIGTYQAGWRWSLHAGMQTARPSENHVGYVLSGRMLIQDANGIEREVGPGEAFEVGPGHDAWVIGNEPCVALDFTHCGN
ncbi:MAG: cupin [Candidatus Brocadia sp.]|nr:cupin [Candidatus Brocadia sp.]